MRILGLAVLVCVAFVATAQASFINYSAREINVKIVYYGATGTTAPRENLTYIYSKTNPDAKGKMIQLSTDEGESTLFFDFLPLSLGEIRGFKTRFHLYTVPSAKAYSASRALILKGVDGIVFIADANPASAKKNAGSFAELKKHLTDQGYSYDDVLIVFQIVGTTEKGALTAEEVGKALGIGDRPMFEAIPTKGIGVFDSLKAIAKLVLMELKKPAADEAPAKPAKPLKGKAVRPKT